MEVKDVNNNTTIQALFAKAVAGTAAGSVLGSGFASLIGQTSDILPQDKPSVEVKASAKELPKDNKSSAFSDRQEVKKDKAAKKTRAVEDRSGPQAVRQTERKQPTADAAVVSAPNVAASETAKPIAQGTVEDAPAEAPFSVVQPKEGAEPQSRELTAALLPAGGPVVMATADGSEMVLMPEAGVDLAALAQMPVVGVLDNATGEVVTMTGAELAAKVQEASAAGNLFVVDENSSGRFANFIPAEVVADVERQFGAKAPETNALPQDGAVLANDELAQQAAVLDSKLNRDTKVKVSVDVMEEKNSYVDGADLVQDKVALDEAVKAALKEKPVAEGRAASVNTPVSTQPQSATSVGQQNSAALNPVAAPIAAAVANDAVVATAKNAAVESVAAAGTDAPALSGTAFAASARNETANRTSDTSFRDIYKGMSKEVVDQVKVNITKSAVKGVDNIEIKLKPEDLGHIEIKMQISKDGKLQAHIVSSRPETMEILQREVQNLEKAFQDAGFQTDEGSLSFSFREGGESGNEQDRSSELRQFIGNVLENDTTDELAGNDNLLGWNPAQGLNIRV